VIRRAVRIVEEHRSELETWLVREGGCVPGKAAFEVDLVLGELWEAAALPTQPWGHLLPVSEPGRESVARRLPVGVVGVISPWNFPQILSIRAVAPSLALGNAVVLKPDVQTAVAGGFLMARIFEEVGLPEGLPRAGGRRGAWRSSGPRSKHWHDLVHWLRPPAMRP
jgi:benzaldehyde dehydrogenase (NAD)